MMQKLWQKKLELKYPPEVWDIVQFGSSVMEGSDPNDIDIAVIYKNLQVKDQLLVSQEIKKQIAKLTTLQVHIKSFDLYSFYDPANFAAPGIMFYGFSLIAKQSFAYKFGLSPVLMISYDLSKLQKKDKVRFHYMLKGKKNNQGLLNKYGGKIVSPGTIHADPKCENIFRERLIAFDAPYKIFHIYLEVK